MGNCMGSKDSQTKITLKHFIMRFRASVPIQKAKLERKLQKQESILFGQFLKQKNARNRPIQQSVIEQVVFLNNMIHLWNVADNCCAKVLDYYSVLQDADNIKHIQTQIQSLLFLNSVIGNQDLSQIYQIITRKYKIKQPNAINNEIADFQKGSNSPNQKMKNEYIMNLCTNRQIQLSKINQVGHNFSPTEQQEDKIFNIQHKSSMQRLY